MIYLIDDTELHKFGAEFLLEHPYKTFIKLISTLEEYELIDQWDTASCICVHRTFCNKDWVKYDISDICDDGNKIPLIIFSAGDQPTATYNPKKAKNWIGGIDKGVFYSRLRAFIDTYIAHDKIDLAEIAYGKSKTFQDIRPLFLSLLKKLEQTDPCQKDIIESILDSDIFKEIVNASNPALKISQVQILSNNKDKPLSLLEIEHKIISILSSFEKYGKNIYPWE